MAEAPIRRILHCDMDCFYAAVHVREDPSLSGRPVVIGGSPEGRGVVAAASYEARAFGVRSAMPAARAARLCPEAVFLRPEFSLYRRESQRIFAIFRRFTPLVQPVSIDEAYLDLTHHLGELGSATAAARAIRRQMRLECSLTVSIGAAPNKLVAKIASDFGKPDGLTVVSPGRVESFLAPLPARRLPGIGPAGEKRLRRLGVETVQQLRALPIELLRRQFGRFGETLQGYARGIDDRPVVVHRQRKSLGAERTFPRDLVLLGELEGELSALAAEVADGLARRDLAACTFTLKVRYRDFTTVTRSRTLAWATADAEQIADIGRSLLSRTEAGRRSIRLLGVAASNLVSEEADQLRLFGPV